MRFQNQFVAHGEIDLADLASNESRCPQRHIVDFGAIKDTIGKGAVNEGDRKESAARKITMAKVAAFKVGEIQVVCRVGQVLVLGIRDVIAHWRI
jgi:hypothetical protein